MNPSSANQQTSPAVQPKLSNDVVSTRSDPAPQPPSQAVAIPVARETNNEPGMFPIGAEHSLAQLAPSAEQKAASQSQSTPSKAPTSEPKKTSGKHWFVISLAIIVSAVLILFAVLAFKQSNLR